MPMIETPHGSISYSVHGKGEPLVILRGLGRTVKHWLGYEKTLAESFQVITLDLRGIGETTVPSTWTTSIFDMARDIVTVLDALAIESAHILGVSLGGMVTLAAGLDHPARCRSLITVNTSIGGMRTLRMSPKAMQTLASGVADHGALHRKLVDVLVGRSCPEQVRDSITKEYVSIAEESGLYIGTVLKQLVGAARFTVKSQLKSLKVPTLVVYGTDDLFVPTINSRKLVQYIPNARLVPIAGGGHELTLDKGDELAAVVRDWTSSLSRSTATSAV